MIEVEVDTWLGHVRVLNAHTGLAVGKLAAPALARSQAAGSIIQGIGYALYEGREIDPRPATFSPSSSTITACPASPTRRRSRCISMRAASTMCGGGSVGIGEVATVPTSAAIANAIRNAIGVRPYEIPIRPDRLLDLLSGGLQHDVMAPIVAGGSGRVSRLGHRSLRAPPQRRLARAAGRHHAVAAMPGSPGTRDGAARIGA